MIIKTVEAKNVSIPLEKPKGYGNTMVTHRDYTLVKITTDDGIAGWGYTYGLHLAKYAVDELKKVLIGEKIEIRRLWRKMLNTRVALFDRGGVSMRAVSAIDFALWDIMGKSLGSPICDLLGKYRDDIPAYYSDGYYPDGVKDAPGLLRAIETEFGEAKEQGFTSFKMKIGGTRAGVDLERIALARNVIGPEAELMLDANSTYDPETIIAMAAKFEKYDITWLEDPVRLDDFPNAAFVASRVSMPVAIGEQNYTMAQFIDIIDRRAGRILMPDTGFCGGFTAFTDYAGLAAAYNIKLSPHCCHDLNIQLALARPEVINLEYMDYRSDIFNIQKVMENPVMADRGIIRPPAGNGHGLVFNEKEIARFEV